MVKTWKKVRLTKGVDSVYDSSTKYLAYFRAALIQGPKFATPYSEVNGTEYWANFRIGTYPPLTYLYPP